MNTILIKSKSLFRRFTGKRKKPKPKALLPFAVKSTKLYEHEKRENYKSFLNGNKPIKINAERPVLSIVIHSCKKPADTNTSIQSVIRHAGHPFNLILLCSAEEKSHLSLFNKLHGAAIIPPCCSDLLAESVRKSSTEYLLFLKSGAELNGNSLDSALNKIKGPGRISSVCGKTVTSNGNLLDAGVIVWRDGSLHEYGNGKDQNDAKYNFSRLVDCGHETFFLTKSQLFLDNFSSVTNYKSMSYAIAEYCFKLRANREKVLYNPETIIKYSAHFRTFHRFFNYQARRDRVSFQRSNREQLKKQFQKKRSNVLYARHSPVCNKGKRILYVDDRIPHYSYGAGFPRANEIVHELINMGLQVTLYPNTYHDDDTWEMVYQDVDRRVEFVQAGVRHRFQTLLASRNQYYDYIWMSRPNNMRARLMHLKNLNKKAAIIYDAESIYAEREMRKSKYKDSDIDKKRLAVMVEEEINLCKMADAVVTVSKADQEKFISEGVKNTFVLGHLASPEATPPNYNSRKDLLFIGNLEHEESPNADSVVWFIKHALPILEQKLPDVNLHLIGSCTLKYLLNLNSKKVHVHGRVEDTTEFYRTCKVFIAPTRFSAGIPLKIIEAASFGIPTVATNLLKAQLGWEHNRHLLASDPDENEFAGQIIKLYTDRALWESIRENALKKVYAEYSYENFKAVMENVFASVD